MRRITAWSRLVLALWATAWIGCSTGSGTQPATTTTDSITTPPDTQAPPQPVTSNSNTTPTNAPATTPTATPPNLPATPDSSGTPNTHTVTSSTPETSPADTGDTASSASDPLNGISSEPDATTAQPSDTPEVRFIGRVVRNGETATFAWSGTGIVAGFNGTTVSVKLNDSGSNQFTVLIDGVLQPVLDTQAGSHSYVLASGLPAKYYTVEIYRRTEASLGETTFEGFDFGADGALAAPPPAKRRRIEIVGDSITCGYGNEGEDSSCGFTPETENHYLTYGAIAARMLDAELSTVAWSGKGVVYNYGTDTTDPMPTLYERVLPGNANSAWDFSVKPDAVVINLGTNDFSTDGDPTLEQFRDAYIALVGQIREGSPDAFILCTNGNMLNGADLDAARAGIHAAVDALTEAGDRRIAAWDMNVPNENPGCDSHPNTTVHARMAEALVAELEPRLP